MDSKNSNIFLNKKVLIYGLGKTGVSSFKFLKKKNDVFLFDDNKRIKQKKEFKKNLILKRDIDRIKFDTIILSPGIDINRCELKNFLKKNYKKIYTDLDVFSTFYTNISLTITGTNGKSTSCQLLYELLKKNGLDVKLAGNIGYPILSIKNIKKKSIFVIEASSYQLEYSKLFNSKYAVILNISPDHLERHNNLRNYISAKFKLIKSQTKNSLAFINSENRHIMNQIKKDNFKSKIIKVKKINKKFVEKINNDYFSSVSNKENLSFILEIAKKLKINKKILLNTIKKFKGLKYRQQVILEKKNFSVINDSKSTSYSSSIEMLKMPKKIFWLLGGVPKKGDKFKLSKIYCKNIRAFIFGKNTKKFSSDLRKKIEFKEFHNLKKALAAVKHEIKIDDSYETVILFSPAAASFDSFKNFEDRGLYFNKLIKNIF